MTIDDDDTTGGRQAADSVEIYLNDRLLTRFTVSRPMTWREKIAVIKKVWALL